MSRTFTPTLRSSLSVELSVAQADGNFSGIANIANSASINYFAASQALMLALSPAPQAGDSCFRSDIPASYVFKGGDPTNIASWEYTAPVSSVFGRAGAVTAQSGDYTVAQVTGALASADLANNSDVAKGSALVGYRPQITGSVGTTQNKDNLKWISVNAFGPTGVYTGAFDTAVVQAALTWLQTAPDGKYGLFFPSGDYYISTLTLTNTNSQVIHFDGARFNGVNGSGNGAMLTIIGATQLTLEGEWTLNGGDQPYECGLYVIPNGGVSVTRLNVVGLTCRNLLTGIKHGLSTNDVQNSETTYLNCNARRCPTAFSGGGSQAGASLIGCNLVAETHEHPTASALPFYTTFADAPLVAMRVSSGFFYVHGGSIVQSNSAASTAYGVEMLAANSPTYGVIYGALKVIGAHLENASKLLYLHNTTGSATTSAGSRDSVVSFSNCGGNQFTASNVVIDTTADAVYAGRVVVDQGCHFYGPLRSTAHIVLGAATVVDILGKPFVGSNGSYEFFQGLSAIAGGVPILRGETIVNMTGSTTSIGASNTLVVMPTSGGTIDAGYGNATYSAGTWTAPQDIHDAWLTVAVNLASAAAGSAFWVQQGAGILCGLTRQADNQTHIVNYLLPFLAKGQTLTIYGVTGAGSIALSGGAANYMRITAKS
jgi:hypothetical protein